jgi:four helix bundle protein
MTNEIKSYEDLDVWQRGIDLAVRLYDVAGTLPEWEKYEMSSQLRRAAVSIPSNVAEGHARRHPKPFLHHVNIALGSLAESVTCLIIAQRRAFISLERLAEERRETDRVGQMLHGLARSLEQRIERLESRSHEKGGSRASTLGLGLVVGALAGWLARLL